MTQRAEAEEELGRVRAQVRLEEVGVGSAPLWDTGAWHRGQCPDDLGRKQSISSGRFSPLTKENVLYVEYC